MIKGCVGFSHIKGRLTGNMILVRGKQIKEVCLPYPLYILMLRLWSSKNILRNFFYKKPLEFNELEKS